MILLLDNYDSFTYNLYQVIAGLGLEIRVVQNDQIDVLEIQRLDPEAIVISPGPGTPIDAGVCLEVIRKFGDSLPMLGVCLGHQCLGVAGGGRLIPATRLRHGETTVAVLEQSILFEGLSSTLPVACYHSLVLVDPPAGYRVTARDETGDILAMEHHTLPLYGVQFHPESYLSGRAGIHIIQNFFRHLDP